MASSTVTQRKSCSHETAFFARRGKAVSLGMTKSALRPNYGDTAVRAIGSAIPFHPGREQRMPDPNVGTYTRLPSHGDPSCEHLSPKRPSPPVPSSSLHLAIRTSNSGLGVSAHPTTLQRPPPGSLDGTGVCDIRRTTGVQASKRRTCSIGQVVPPDMVGANPKNPRSVHWG